MTSKKRKNMKVRFEGETPVVDLGDMEIWDGADLALLRETLTKLIEADGHHSIGVDLTFVKYIPSGFFGMLFEWYDDGIIIELFSPQPNVEKMLWFRMFFEHHVENCFRLNDEAVRDHSPGEQVEYHRERFEDDDTQLDERVDSDTEAAAPADAEDESGREWDFPEDIDLLQSSLKD